MSCKARVFFTDFATVNRSYFFLIVLAFTQVIAAQPLVVQSPNGKIKAVLVENTDSAGKWFLQVEYDTAGHSDAVFTAIQLGLSRNDESFAKDLKLVKTGKPVSIIEEYTALHGKRSKCSNEAMERVFTFKNSKGSLIKIAIRAYNDGLAFRYTFPEKKSGLYTMKDEYTAYQLAHGNERWLQNFIPSYEGFYNNQKTDIKQGEWNYPALFTTLGNTCWALISEADVHGNYCNTKLTNTRNADSYQLTFPAATDGNSKGDVNPQFTLPWVSPWRVVVIGQLADIVQSTLIEDVSEPTRMRETSWIQPGNASWVYWAYNHGTKDFKKLCEYTDLSARMGWNYTLFDWEWDEMSNGGKLEDAVKYALGKGIKPLIWYNSGGPHNRVSATPRDRMLTHENRMKEFAWLKQMGVYGVKIDFFESDKQNIIQYYLDILQDAAQFKMMLNFHGATLPRGWSRTYPNLMSMEAVAGAEQYNNGKTLTDRGAWHNTMLPFTRNVVGPMDYTPVAFTNSQNPHTTTYAHELALSVLYESGIQHFADRPAGFDNLPDPPKDFLKHVPAAWDDTRFVTGFPGRNVVLARCRGNTWYMAGINGENKAGTVKLDFHFLPAGRQYRLTLIADGDHDSAFSTQYLQVNNADTLQVNWLARGGFSILLQEM